MHLILSPLRAFGLAVSFLFRLSMAMLLMVMMVFAGLCPSKARSRWV